MKKNILILGIILLLIITALFTIDRFPDKSSSISTNKVDYLEGNETQDKIEITKLLVGDNEYNNIDKDTATKMFNGFNNGNNSESNRFIINIGENITVNVSAKEGYSFVMGTNNNTFKLKDETSYKNGIVSASFIATNPGNNEIILKDDKGNVIDSFYIQAHYSFYINTDLGEVNKDFIHEYESLALENFYNKHEDAVITDPDGNPKYIKNGMDYNMYYYLFNNKSVTISTYVNKDDDKSIELTDNLQMNNKEIEIINSGDKAGFKKITIELSIKSGTSAFAKIGDDVFMISDRNQNNNINHIDLTTIDNGTLIKRETINYKDGKTTITETTYSASIIKINNSKIYKGNKVIKEIPSNEYWSSSNTFTSTYITNKDGHLIDANNNNIDVLFQNGLVRPQIATRNIQLSDIDKIDFNVNLSLTPISKKVSQYQTNKDGKKEFIKSTDETVDSSTTEQLNDYTITMTDIEMVDAFNRCPYQSGFDFNLKINLLVETTDEVNESVKGESVEDNPKTSSTSIIIAIIVLIISAEVFIILKNTKVKRYN